MEETLLGRDTQVGGLFLLNIVQEIANNANISNSTYIAESINLWHSRLGHVNIASIKRLRKMELIPVVNIDDVSKCPVCVEAQHAKKPFKYVTSRKTELLELEYSDLADFKNIASKGGKKYYITFVDDFSRYTKVYLFKSKDEAENIFLKFKSRSRKSIRQENQEIQI